MNFAILGSLSLSSSYVFLLALCLCGDLPTCSWYCWRLLFWVYSCDLVVLEVLSLEEVLVSSFGDPSSEVDIVFLLEASLLK